MSCVRNVIFLFAFAINLWANAALFSPQEEYAMLRSTENEFGVSYLGNSLLHSFSGFGAWNIRSTFMGFRYVYSQMDSVYHAHYAELQSAYNHSNFSIGGSYGFSMEWTFEKLLWTRHHLDFELLVRYRSMKFLVWKPFFTDEILKAPIVWSGFFWKPTPHFEFSATSNFERVIIGSEFCFSALCLNTSYEFPSFRVALGVSFGVKNAKIKAEHTFSGASLDWNYVSLWGNIPTL